MTTQVAKVRVGVRGARRSVNSCGETPHGTRVIGGRGRIKIKIKIKIGSENRRKWLISRVSSAEIGENDGQRTILISIEGVKHEH